MNSEEFLNLQGGMSGQYELRDPVGEAEVLAEQP